MNYAENAFLSLKNPLLQLNGPRFTRVLQIAGEYILVLLRTVIRFVRTVVGSCGIVPGDRNYMGGPRDRVCMFTRPS